MTTFLRGASPFLHVTVAAVVAALAGVLVAEVAGSRPLGLLAGVGGAAVYLVGALFRLAVRRREPR